MESPLSCMWKATGYLFRALLLVCLPVLAWGEVVGSVQLMIGHQAQIWGEDAQTRPVKEGMSVHEGDWIETQDAVVHLRMRDNALISLRPHSRLHIACYHEGEQPCVKLELEKGEIRQITGKIGQRHKQRFRLNTPVAAIGVRGTDFVSRVLDDKTLVRVVSGEVVAAPFDGKVCTPSGLGICTTRWAASLRASDDAVLLIQPGQPAQRILAQKVHSRISNVTSSQQDKSLVFEDLSQHPEKVQAYLQANGLDTDNLAPVKAGSVQRYGDLVFATWTEQFQGMRLSYPEASSERVVTVGNSEGAIWRVEAPYRPPKAVVDYQLKEVEAEVHAGAGSLPVKVDNATLRIDFVRSKVETQLQAVMPERSVSVTAAGPIGSVSGMFVLPTDQGGQVAGAVSHDGRQAGYMVHQPIADDQVLDARLLWQAP